MNVLERTALRLVWKRVIGGNVKLKTWLPLIASFVVLSTIVLRAFGQTGTADAIDSVARAIGLTDVSIVDATLVTAAVGGLVGQGLKVKSEIQKARGKA